MHLEKTHGADERVARHWTIIEKSLGVLRQGCDPRHDRVACIYDSGAELEVEWVTREAAASRLRAIAHRSEGLNGIKDLAQRLVRPFAASRSIAAPVAEEPIFDCLVMAQGLLSHFEITAPDARQDAIERVANLIATLRGLRAATFDVASAPEGLGYAVRSPGCAVCASWRRALSDAGVWCAEMQAPSPVRRSDADARVCATCVDELSAAVAAAHASLQLAAEDVQLAAHPQYVLGYLGIVEP